MKVKVKATIETNQTFELEDIKNIIREEIEKNKSSLGHVIWCIQETSNINLSTIDCAYIKSKYIKYCSNLWLQEVTNFLAKVKKNNIKQQDVAQEIISKVSTVQNINQISNYFNKLQYYDLLLKHYQSIDRETERIILDNFKELCFKQLIGCNDIATKELAFLVAFKEFLNSFETLEIIIKTLFLSEFYTGNISFHELLKIILNLETEEYGEELVTLQSAAKFLEGQDYFLLLNEIKEITEGYVVPVKILNMRLDNRSYIEVKGRIININEVLVKLEEQLQNTKDSIDEVHFVGSDSVHIRVSLQRDIWHGKNIVIYTNIIKVHDVVTWDVSGNDASHVYSNSAGRHTNGFGENGIDGYAGESGGNVKICAKSIENPEKWTIVSNGGNGGKGQDGGNGQDGLDGKGIQTSTFCEKFPSIVSFACARGTRIERLNNMVSSIKSLGTVKTDWNSSNHVFLKVETNDGNEITFSHCTGTFTTRYQAFLLYGGSLGKPGCHGGECGLGGQGGYFGKIDVCNPGVKVETKSGQNGNNGKSGLHGNYGKNGWDMAYADYQHWKETLFYGKDMQSKLTIDYYRADNLDCTRIWCPYHDKYAEITARTIVHNRQSTYEERQRSEENRALQKHALPVRKNNIISATFVNYSDYCNRVDNILQRLKVNLEQTECNMLQVLDKSEKQEEKVKINVEVNTRRCATSTCLNEDKKPSIQSSHKVKIFKEANKESKDTLIETLKSSKSFKDWVAIKNRLIPYSDLKQLFIIFNKIKKKKENNKWNKSNIKSIGEILIWKYKFAILQELQLQSYKSLSEIEDKRWLPINMAKYLIVTKEVNNKVSHKILGTLNQYIFDDGKEQRSKICKFFRENLPDENDKTFKHSIKAFILETKDAVKVDPHVEKYCNEYLEYLQKKSYNMNESLEIITKEVQKHKGLYDLWIKYIIDESEELTLESSMKKDPFLFKLYCRFKDELKKEYDWSNCCANKYILNEHNKYMEENGLMSTSYRELLASLFDVNIQIYKRDENRFSLLYSHNRSSEKSIYLLQRNNEYAQLEIDEDYLRLNKERKWKNNVYALILKNIELLTQKEELDKYLECRPFMPLPDVHNAQLEWPLYDEDNRNEEDVYIEQILNYFSDETNERSKIRQRLKKLKYEFIGQRGFLYCLAQNFLNEGRHISTQVLYYLINSILNNVIQSEEKSIIFHWIITSYSQRYWLSELIFLQLENYFKKPLTVEQLKWKERLLKIDDDMLMLLKVKLNREKSVSIQCIDDILYLLSNIPNEVTILNELGLHEWPYFLKEEYWMAKLSKLVDWKENDELLTASYYVLSVENNFGTVVVEKLLEIIEAKKQKFTSKDLIYILCNFHNENWQLNENALSTFRGSNLNDWMQIMEDEVKLRDCLQDRNILQLISLIKDNSNTTSRISSILPKIKEYIHDGTSFGKTIQEFTESDIRKWVKSLNDSENNITPSKSIKHYIEERYAEVLGVVDRAIELKKGFKLRDTQKLSILTLLVNESSALEQVSTGEGKSLIVVAVSIVKALCGEKVDIITSSSVLAKRDAEENKNIYKLFDVAVSHNCDEIIEKRKAAYSNNQIVYGDLSSFQRDYLLDRFYKKNILGNRTFDNIIVDEVDSMLLDKGNNMLYLSHDLAGLDKLESIYIFIWQLINKPCGSFEDFRHAFNPKVIKDAVIYDLYGLIEEEDITTLDTSLKKEDAIAIWGCLVDANVLDNRGRLLLKENFSIKQTKEILPEGFNCYADGLHYLINETINRERHINIPNYLKTFIEEHLDTWINNARIALFMEERYDYIVDIDRSGTSCDRNPQIVILDRDTGTDQKNSQWDEALHQFLQLKHGCKLSLQSLKAVFVSNVSYFKLYDNLYGLSGTLGLHGERSLLEDIYKVDFAIVPTAKPKQFVEMKPILCDDTEEWIDEICQMANKLTTEKLRSVLIICETVKDVERLHIALGGKDATNIHTYVRDYEEFEIAKGDREMNQKQIIIATNLAGRGTDIKITRELNEAGGLHVCLTYLPNNTRIEQQAFGRAARSGNKGSGQLIIISPEEKRIFYLKKQRDVEELCRISRIKDHYEKQTLVEENYFNRFKDQYEKLDKRLEKSQISDTLKDILLQCCLDEWAFWLDRNSKHINKTDEEKKVEILEESIDLFIEKLQSKCKENSDWSEWVKDHPCHMLKLGVHFAGREMYSKAIDLFDKIIKQEPDFSVEACYYKAFIIGKKINWEKKNRYKGKIKEFKEQLRKVSKRLEKLQGNRICAATIISKLNGFNNEGIIKIDAYAAQQKSVNEVFSSFSKTIDDIFGHSITPQHFVGHNIKETLAMSLCEDMIKMEILVKPKVAKNIPKVALNKISHDYDVPIEKLTAFFDTVKGKNINEQSFIKELKRNLVLPSREMFWKKLITEGVLTDEVAYFILNKEKLQDCDPSLLNKLLQGEAKDKSEDSFTDSNFKQVFLYAEQVNAHKDGVLVKKDFLIGTVDTDKYHTLKKKGIFSSSNKVARINTEKAQSIIFPQYDSITINNFNKINITTEEAEKILAELVSKNMLESDASNKNIYRLVASHNEIHELELSFRPIYNRSVKVLLLVCFAYRIALQKLIESSMQSDTQLIHLQLVAKPHKDLFCSLMDEGIVKPCKVTTKSKDMKSDLEKKYSKKMPKTDIMDILKQSKLIPLKFLDEALFNHFIEKKWILECSLFRDATVSLQYLYSVNCRKKRESLNSIYKDIEETLHAIMDDMIRLREDDTIMTIVSTLEQLKSMLKTLDCPNPCLKPLIETGINEFANIEEIRIFCLNGFDQLLMLEEKKWTTKMLINTALAITIGICQITIGVLIELYSVGAMTHVGSAFISEGISDIMFASSALLSGHFSWKDYRQHKLQSLISTIATAGIGMYFARGVKLSHFGHKIAGSSLQVGKQKLSETAGKALINVVAKSTTNIVTVSLTKEVIKRIVQKVIQGVAFGLVNASVDLLLQNYLHTFCNSLTFTLLRNIEEKVAKHRVSSTLRESYKVLGKEGARKMINDLTKIMSKDKHYSEKLISSTSQICNSLIQGLSQAASKISKANNNTSNFMLSINRITQIFVWTERVSHIGQITLITDDYLDKMDQKIRKQLDYKKPTHSKEETVVTDEECKEFEREIIERWKSILREEATRVIEQQIVGPIIKGFFRQLVTCFGKMIKVAYRSYKEDRHFQKFKKLQRNYRNKLKDIAKQDDNVDKDEIKVQLRKEYDNSLLKLLAKTRNPKLFAAIVKEGVPMEITCLKSCAKVIPMALKKKGIAVRPFSLNVEGDNGVQECIPSEEGTTGQCINLKLKDNHFTLCDSDISANANEEDITPSDESENAKSRNNCLFKALKRAIPELNNLTEDEFRHCIADYIRTDPNVKYFLSQGRHRFPLALNYYGGERRETKKISSKQLQEKIKDGTFKFSQDSIASHTKEAGLHVGELSEKIKKDKWEGNPVRVLETKEGNYTTLDHRRVLAVAISDDPTVELEMAVYGPDDEFSTENDETQSKGFKNTNAKYETTAAGLAKKRMSSGNLKYNDDLDGFTVDQVKIRLRKSNYQYAKEAEKRLEELGFQMGGQRSNQTKNTKYSRSKSANR